MLIMLGRLRNLFIIDENYELRQEDEVAEWLRRWTANPLCSARVGSNPIHIGNFFIGEFFNDC